MFEFRKLPGRDRPPTKTCLKCRKEKNVHADFYWSRSKGETWPHGRCKECAAADLKERRALAKQQRGPILRNKNKPTMVCRECGTEKNTATGFHAFAQPCRKCCVNRSTVARQTPDGRAARKAEYERNKDAAKAKAKAWKLANPARARANRIAYSKTDKCKAAHRDKLRRRRAAAHLAIVEGAQRVDSTWFESLKAEHGHKCYYCFGAYTALEMEHVIPLARGGKHTRENIVPACRTCNASKNDKLVSEWRPWIDIPVYGLELASA